MNAAIAVSPSDPRISLQLITLVISAFIMNGLPDV